MAAGLGPRLLGYSSLVVYGGSMADSISVGSIAVTEEVRAEDVSVGNVIVFHPPEAAPGSPPVMHRVVSVREENGQRFFQTKGDANQAPDPLEFALLNSGSRVVYAVPYVGYLVHFAHAPLGWLLLMVLPAAHLGISGLRRIWAGQPRAR
jgi:signal peptidase I